MDIQPPKGAQCVAQLLKKAGYEAYIVGGCVRDSFLKRTPKDWDITTNATPEQMTIALEALTSKEVFDMGVVLFELVPTGIAYGTVTIFVQLMGQTRFNRESYEVTTYRIDEKYSDGRHPDDVTFAPNLQVDLSRRDFTVNALALGYDADSDKWCLAKDLVGGMEDLESHTIRCVGNPNDRFKEDALRMMRAIRFVCQLDFKLDAATREAIIDNRHRINSVSKERIRDELVKILCSPYPEFGIMLMRDLGLLWYILLEVDSCDGVTQSMPWHIFDVFDHTMEALKQVKHTTSSLVIRLAVLFHDIGKPQVKSVGDDGICHFYGHPAISAELAQNCMERLRFDNATISQVVNLVRYHDVELKPEKPVIRRIMQKLIYPEMFLSLIQVRQADIMAQNPSLAKERLQKTNACVDTYGEIMRENSALKVTDLAVDGHDVMDRGFMGKKVGTVLNGLLVLVTDDTVPNDRTMLLRLLDFAKEITK